ncbi:acyltransferase [Vibrio methylphosphonaticus]|uniref:acyltransferase n=1 Tax=Vibrio methylphosphonaticus TaxID=2946866 RepID=UPI00202A44A1|nr:acyltransferase [Vibrio methylphosphonaticus]MCL9775447.1 acyltransferase [Vibrio methylphosphonaticus]
MNIHKIKSLITLKLFNKLRFKSTAKVNISPFAKLRGCRIQIQGKNNTLTIEANTYLKNTCIEIVGNNCQVHIGHHVHIGDDCYLSAREAGTILSIGNHTCLSRNVKLMTSDGHDILKDGVRINQAKSIKVGQSVWITDNVTVLKGVTVGDGAILGINSTVTKSVGEKEVAVGNPAKIVTDNIEWKASLTY